MSLGTISWLLARWMNDCDVPLGLTVTLGFVCCSRTDMAFEGRLIALFDLCLSKLEYWLLMLCVGVAPELLAVVPADILVC